MDTNVSIVPILYVTTGTTSPPCCGAQADRAGCRPAPETPRTVQGAQEIAQLPARGRAVEVGLAGWPEQREGPAYLRSQAWQMRTWLSPATVSRVPRACPAGGVAAGRESGKERAPPLPRPPDAGTRLSKRAGPCRWSQTPLGWRLSSSARGDPCSPGRPGGLEDAGPGPRRTGQRGPAEGLVAHLPLTSLSRNSPEILVNKMPLIKSPWVPKESSETREIRLVKFCANIGRRAALHLSWTYLPRDPSWGEAPSG